MSELPKFVTVGDKLKLAGIPLRRTCNIYEAKERFNSCRVPLPIPPGTYVRVAHDQNAAILQLVRFDQPWTPHVSWITRTRHLLPRRTLYSRELPIEVSPQDLASPCVHPNAPSHLSSVWRYMDRWKFEDMLNKSAIFLSRSDLVPDVHEGTLSLANVCQRRWVYMHRQRKMAKRHSVLVRELANVKRWTYICCWRVDDNEDAQCWERYITEPNGIAVRTTYRKLLERTATIFCAGIDYIDYENDWVIETNPLLPFTYKQRQWNWEREFRIIIQQFPRANITFDDALYCDCAQRNPNCGISLQVDLGRLIDKIVVGPGSSREFFECVRRGAAKAGLDSRVNRSTLD
jgi:hypothetical protein